MIDHLDGSISQPRQFLVTETGIQSINPAFFDLAEERQSFSHSPLFHFFFTSTCYGSRSEHLPRSLEQA